MNCPHCTALVFRPSPGKLKARTKILVLHKSGEVEINCGVCGKGVLLPLVIKPDSLELRKADSPKLIVRKA